MCGIFGFIGNGSCNIINATNIIKHRGPDSCGYLGYDIYNRKIESDLINVDSIKGKRVLFGFRRLSIIDLTTESNQPYSDLLNGLHIIFNGEIFNYLELKKELVGFGYQFKTNSDTEVLLKAYLHWGIDCLNKLNGMWAFSILDEKNGKLICARDRFGIKPFYYNYSSGSLIFGSEIKQLLTQLTDKSINVKVVKDFIDKSIIDHSEMTFFENIKKILPGHYFEIDLNDEIHPPLLIKYYQLKIQNKYNGISYSEACSVFLNLLTDSIRLRHISDVAVGSCLSGGLDSSSIVSISAKIQNNKIPTFTSTSTLKEYDESEYVKILEDKYPNLNSHFCTLNEENFINDFDSILWHQDEPFGSMSLVSQWEVMKLANLKKIKVLLDGQGGDELLGGYRKYYAFLLRDKLSNGNYFSFFKNLIHLFKSRDFGFFNKQGIFRYLGINSIKRSVFTKEFNDLPTNSNIGLFGASTFRNRVLLDIEKYSFPSLLRYEDRNSMAFSIEARVPFMDYRLIEFLFSLPIDYLIKDGFTKAVLRDGLKDVLPVEIRLRKSKLGFASPQKTWMTSTLHSYFLNYFENMDNKYFNKKELVLEFKKFKDNKFDSDKFFRIYCLDKWMKLNGF
jgi:asparagine synthase (glutamine-hydrolysing)